MRIRWTNILLPHVKYRFSCKSTVQQCLGLNQQKAASVLKTCLCGNWKWSDIPVLWGVDPSPEVLLVFPTSWFKEHDPFCKSKKCPQDRVEVEVPWQELHTLSAALGKYSYWPPHLHSHAVLHQHLVPQLSCVLDLVTLDNTTGRWYTQLPFRSTSLSSSVLLGMRPVLFYIGHSESNTTYLFLWKLQQLQRA